MKINELNAKLVNGWKVDTWYYICHKEKQIEKIIPINEIEYYRFTINYSKSYSDPLYKMVMYLSKWKKEGDFSTSHGLGKKLDLTQNIYKQRNFNKLADASILYTTEVLQKYIEENRFNMVSGGGLIVEEW